MTQPVTGGTIAVEDGTKAAEEYTPARKVRVELRFDIEDEKNPVNVISYVSTLASDEVDRLLGRIKAAQSTVDPDELHPAALALVEPPKSRTRKPKAEPPETPSTPDTATEPDASSAEGDDWDEPVTTVITVTDAELNAAATAKNATLKAPPKIKALIGEFNPDPTKQFSLSQIPQNQRKLFLERLDALS